jgi:hypothetical protein
MKGLIIKIDSSNLIILTSANDMNNYFFLKYQLSQQLTNWANVLIILYIGIGAETPFDIEITDLRYMSINTR